MSEPECNPTCLYGVCSAPGTMLGCGGCCGCLGGCVVEYEKTLEPAPLSGYTQTAREGR